MQVTQAVCSYQAHLAASFKRAHRTPWRELSQKCLPPPDIPWSAILAMQLMLMLTWEGIAITTK